MCQFDEDCPCQEQEEASCLDNGICACVITATEKPQCEDKLDCSEYCEIGDEVACAEGACTCTRVIETSQLVPGDIKPRVSYTAVGDADDLRSAPAGSKNVVVYWLAVSTPQAGMLKHLHFTMYTNTGEGAPETPITSIVEEASLYDYTTGAKLTNGQIVDEKPMFDGTRQAVVEFNDLDWYIPGYESGLLELRVNLREDVNELVHFTTALLPCSEGIYNNVEFITSSGEELYAQPSADGGCSAVNDVQLTVIP
ncbi:hypothetical protein GF376_01650 [Candidatus Peregrinibacteria bacterium]|nr:hypothetical protein [Candidatus Peregrinibacteria bacterium]